MSTSTPSTEEQRKRAREYMRKYRAENPDKEKKWRANGYYRDVEKSREYQRKYKRDVHRFGQYGITKDIWIKMSENGCMLCGDFKRLCVDHDHETGRVRGALCAGCNGALGKLGDTVASIQTLLDYVSGNEVRALSTLYEQPSV